MAENNPFNRPPALILGRPNANLLGQARALGGAGIYVICILTRGEPPIIARVSRYIRQVIVAQCASDERVVEAIREVYERFCQKPILFFGGDYDITLTARIWPRISELVTPVTPPEPASRYNDKALQIETVQRAGVQAPNTIIVRSSADIQYAVEQASFPVICRPIELARKGRFEGKLFIVRNKEDFKTKISPIVFGDASEAVLVQEYIPGGNDQIYFALASCDETGQVRAMVTGRKLYEYPEGLMCIGETLENYQLSSQAEKVFSAIGLSGLLGVEFKYDEERDCFWFIEVNLRPENFHSIALKAGVNLVLDAYHVAASVNQHGFPSRSNQKLVFWRDISMVMLSRLSGNNLPKIGSTAITDAYWSSRDPFPALAWYFIKLYRFVRSKIFV